MKTKKKTYTIYTQEQTGWQYKVKANSKKEAIEALNNGDYADCKLDTGWMGDSQQEVYLVKEHKK